MEELIILLIIWLFRLPFLILRWIYRQIRAALARSAARRDRSSLRVARAAATAGPSALSPVLEAHRQRIANGLKALVQSAEALATQLQAETPSARFVPTLREYIIVRAIEAGRTVAPNAAVQVDDLARADRELEALSQLKQAVDELARQRRDARQLAFLGDIDALADACYQPVIDFCRMRGIPLRTQRPAALVGDKSLSTTLWLQPTGVAVLHLPTEFPDEIGWWPAVAHEVGHDFYYSVAGLEQELLTRFGLDVDPLLPSGPGSMHVAAPVSAWLSEIFADTAGTLLLGPAYVTTMQWTFAPKGDLRQAVTIAPTADGLRYEEHPPAHLRVRLACRLLERMGFHKEAKRLAERWDVAIGHPQQLLVPTHAGWVAAPIAPILDAVGEIAERIYTTSLKTLRDEPLLHIAGFDYGPGRHAQAEAARVHLREGKPYFKDPRAIVAGAVLAWSQEPSRAAAIRAAARRSLLAVGTRERATDAYDEVPGAEAPAGESAVGMTDLVRDAIVLSAILTRQKWGRWGGS